jgi:hypothetical protein
MPNQPAACGKKEAAQEGKKEDKAAAINEHDNMKGETYEYISGNRV